MYGSSADTVTDVEVTLSTGETIRRSTHDGLWLFVLRTPTPWDVANGAPIRSITWLDSGGAVIQAETDLRSVGGRIVSAVEPGVYFEVSTVTDNECVGVTTVTPDGGYGYSSFCDFSPGADGALPAGVFHLGMTVTEASLDLAVAIPDTVTRASITTRTGATVPLTIEPLAWNRPLKAAWAFYDLETNGGPPVAITLITDAGRATEATTIDFPDLCSGNTEDIPGC